jgi:hypothetical protein
MVEIARKEIIDFIDENLSVLYLQEKYVPIQVNEKDEVEENFYDADYDSYDGFAPALWCESCGDHAPLILNITLEENCIKHYLEYHTENEE